MPAAALILLYLALALAPLGFAWAQGLAPRSPWDELASGLGLVALAMILLEFLQLGRFRATTARVGSDVVMRAHQLLARVALGAALLHPFLYTAPMKDAPVWDTTRQTAIDTSWHGLWPGIAAWLLLGALVASGIGRDALGIRYQTWRALHGLGAVLVAGGGTLHALRAGRYSADPALASLWLAFLALAIGALLWVYVISPLKQLRHPFRVAAVTRAAERTWRLNLAPDGPGPFRYRAGQFAWLTIGHPVWSLNDNPFSIASAPAQGEGLEFIIKELGDSTSRLGSLRPGTRVWVDGPHGHLTFEGHQEAPGVALIAGGVGIAPLLGLLREMAATDDPRPTTLLYGNRVQEQIVAGEELETLAQTHGTQITHVLSEPPNGWTGPTGQIDAPLLRAHFGRPEHRDWLYVLCGPPAMIEAVEGTLIELGVPASNILSELFRYD
ncbi:ferredoxin reductase family protein [uncultured Roseovarius sp.]|uniref:ferredoxin reductase family protein n=1 Tax=uncultured Roseovarius sp. TaxID=293344 RepID=UPI0025EA6935|nr:ferredoxin reductase family protein [uncultured Roseovarius sp.]